MNISPMFLDLLNYILIVMFIIIIYNNEFLKVNKEIDNIKSAIKLFPGHAGL